MSNIVKQIENYISRFVSFTDEGYTFPIALWTIGTHLFESFDAFAYVTITSDTKRSGKTRLAEMVSFLCWRPKQFGAMTPATLFHTIDAEKPTIFFDEAEVLSSESANTMRAVLNMGYRRGQAVPRKVAEYYNPETQTMSQVKDFVVYCPKVFILIGDVMDTLRDRSIVIRMKRGEPKERFTFELAKTEALPIVDQIKNQTDSIRSRVKEAFLSFNGVEFLTDRDEEIWTPLFILCSVLCPERIAELSRIAVDMATEKTQEKREYVNLQGQEKKAEDDEYAKKLLADLHAVINGEKWIRTSDALDKLKALPTSPWRKFRGDGLTAMDMGFMLSRFGVSPQNIRPPKSRQVFKGYKREQVADALKK